METLKLELHCMLLW